jgi:transposase
MSNVLDQQRQQQIVALGRLGWSLRRIEETTGVRRETASEYLKAAGIPVRGRGGRPRVWPPKPATTPEVSTDSGGAKPAISGGVSTDSNGPKPATRAEVSTDLAAGPLPGRAPSASACEPYRELIERALERGRNAMAIWQDLVDTHGFDARYSSVRRFVQTLRQTVPEPHAVITTAPGEDYGESAVMVSPEEARRCGAAFSRTLFA